MKGKISSRRYAGLTVFVAAATAALLLSGAASAVSGAADTTDNFGYVEPSTYVDQHCVNGSGDSPRVNCNIYNDKRDVWMNGGPTGGQSNLSEGWYFFAVLSPGGQPNPNDGAPLRPNGNDPNLSDNQDASSNRVFHVNGDGQIDTYSGSHLSDNQYFDPSGLLIQLFPYDDTPNPGGVYILAACFLSSDSSSVHTVAPQDCKYDAFKVLETACVEDCTPPVENLTVEKGAIAGYKTTFSWTVVKTVDGKESVSYTASSATLQYKVEYTKGTGVDSDWDVHDTITVTNPNSFDVTAVKVSDVLDDGTQCLVGDGSYTDGNGNPQTVSNGLSGGTIPSLTAVEYQYSCSPTGTAATKNTATASWDIGNNLPNTSKDGFADVTWPSPTLVHDCVNVSDTIPAPIVGPKPLGSICLSTTYNYSKTVTIANACTTVGNTAAFADGPYTNSDSTTAQLCGLVTGGLTIGFWQNKNGQAIITSGAATAGVCNSATYLRTFAPFQDLSATANCSAVALYVSNIIKAATAKGAAMNAMLKAQMLATALDVFFLKVNGGTYVDLTKICKMIDGSGGTATCSGIYRSVSAAFGGATCLRVSDILTYAAGQYVSASSWYGQVKATQELAKDTFDAINNQVAFSCSPGP